MFYAVLICLESVFFCGLVTQSHIEAAHTAKSGMNGQPRESNSSNPLFLCNIESNISPVDSRNLPSQRRHRRKPRRGGKKPNYPTCDIPNRDSMSLSAQAHLARRLHVLRRRPSLKVVCSGSCLATQQFFGDRNIDILKESSEMEKPSHDKRYSSMGADDQMSLQQLAGWLLDSSMMQLKEANFAGRLLKRRPSLKVVCSESCLATQEFFGDKNIDILKECSDMEKPSGDSRCSMVADDQTSLQEIAGWLLESSKM